MDRNYLAGRIGDAVNAVLAAVGYNFRRILAWPGRLLAALGIALADASQSHRAAQAA